MTPSSTESTGATGAAYTLDNTAFPRVKITLCGAMAEPGALPQLIAAMPYESQRQQLRRMTNGQCGPQQ